MLIGLCNAHLDFKLAGIKVSVLKSSRLHVLRRECL